MNGIQIKSYLFPVNSKVSLQNLSDVEEIRRFNLQGNSYSSLIDKLQQTYGPALEKREEIRTYWQDEDNDLISFTSDSELTYAIELMNGLKASKPYEAKASVFKVYVAKKGEEHQHKNHKCKRGNVNANQEEVKIHFGVVCDSCDGSIIGNRYKCTVCNDYDLCEVCKSKGIHSEHEMKVIQLPVAPMFGGKCQRRGGLDRRCRSKMYGHPLENMMKDMWKIPQTVAGAAGVPLVGNQEQLKSFGENLKKFLDPFGIDVSYYVDSMTKGESEKKKEAEESKTVPMNETVNDDIEEVVVEKPLNEVNEGLIPNLVIGSNSQASAPDQSESEEVSLIDLQKSVEEPFKEVASVLNTIAASYGSNEAVASSSGMVDGFSLVEIDKELKIIRAIEQLNAMGYTDDGGWLTRLVSAKNGNINAVLDAITPGPKK